MFIGPGLKTDKMPFFIESKSLLRKTHTECISIWDFNLTMVNKVINYYFRVNFDHC